MSPPATTQPDDPIVASSTSAGSSSEISGSANQRTDTVLGYTVPSDTLEMRELNRASKGPGTQPRVASKESDHSQSLRSKVVLSLALMLGIVVGIDEIVRITVIAPEFASLERVAAIKDTNRVLSAINTEIDFLAETASNDAKQYGRDWELDRTRQVPNVRVHADRVEWAAIVSDQGNWEWLTITRIGSKSDPASDILEDLPTKQSSESRLEFPGISEIVTQTNTTNEVAMRGVTRESGGDLYLYAVLPLERHRDGNPLGASEAFYVVGQRFCEEVIAELEHRTRVQFSIQPILRAKTIPTQIEIDSDDSEFLYVKSPLVSASGKSLAELNVQLPRDVINRSNRTTAFARYLSLCGACASLLLLLLLLQRIVIGRLEKIRQHTERIAQAGIISDGSSLPTLSVGGYDEIGQLAQSFDRMRARLGEAQRRLSDASHAAGMSLVADTVIHNVGNVLTNVNSLIETASIRVDNLRIEPLEKLASQLRKDQVDEALQKATPDYLQRLSETLEDDKDDLAALLQTLDDNVQHIHQVICDQRRHANQPVKWDQVDARHLVDEAVKFCKARLDQDNVRVEFDCNFAAKIWTDRSLLIQILINIIGNAGNATRGLTCRQPTLTIDLVRTKSAVHIRFRDNGCGMDSETLSRVFEAHFTTGPTGSGLGLHFCAIAIKRIGGAIQAESEGLETGATFILEIPITKPSNGNSAGPTQTSPSTEMDEDRNAVAIGFPENPGEYK